MIFAEKLKEARTRAGLSQEQLAEKISVSRSAVAKWETGKGLPDIENIKAISHLLDVSIDALLSDEESFSLQTTRVAIDLDNYQVVKPCRNKYDAAVVAAFPQAESIVPVFRRKKRSRIEILLEWTVMPTFGIFQTVDQIHHPELYYLVNDDGKQYLVSVGKEFLTSFRLARHITDKRFTIGNDRFYRAAFQINSNK